MNWENRREAKTDLFIFLGMVLIIIGFIQSVGFSSSTIILSGILIIGLGVWRYFNDKKKSKGRKKKR